MTGTYHCVVQDNAHKVWHFISVNSLWGAWLHLDITYPPQNGQPKDVAVTYLGFDPAAKRWNIVSPDEDGSYFTRYSTSQALNGSRWIDGYPADGRHAVLRIPRVGQYTFDLWTSKRSNNAPDFRVVCNRV
jgi:hypothetical protein